ncbi:atherin-like [Sorghum bicolor]|uniref:atherin-like n=1 Tax=Sorghum bicolor TaxID=4558 RepID=UPI000B426A4E|nr:atherin-like [Sorghum bicolor]|eukprot:XP_021317796.1 atherin-like [Sorghum bicolor]
MRLCRPPRARPQLTRPPLHGRRCLPRCCAARRARWSRSPACPRSALPNHRSPPAASATAAHPAAAARPPPAARRVAGHERDALRVCGSVARRESGRSSPGRRYSAATARPSAAPPAASACPSVLAVRYPIITPHPPPARLPLQVRPQLTLPPLLGHHPPLGAPPVTSATPDAGARATRPSTCSVHPSP